MYHLFLDDFRVPSEVTWVALPRVAWVMARNYNEFVKCIRERGIPIYVTFDHDLAEAHYPTKVQTGKEIIDYDSMKEKSGYHYAQWLINYCREKGVKLPNWNVHSHNNVGRNNIIQLLKSFSQ